MEDVTNVMVVEHKLILRMVALVEKNVAVVDPLLCEACGACTMACPNKAAQQYGSAPKQVLMGLDELLG